MARCAPPPGPLPDPRRPESHAQEVPHSEAISLHRVRGRWRLEHLLTGEMAIIESNEGVGPALHVSPGHGFAYISIGGRVAWVNSVLKTSAWRLEGDLARTVVLEKLVEGATTTKWLEEVRREFVSDYIEVFPDKTPIKVLCFRVPQRHKWRMLWQVQSLALLLLDSSEENYKSSSAVAVRQWITWGLHKSWAARLKQLGAGDDHVFHPLLHPSQHLGAPWVLADDLCHGLLGDPLVGPPRRRACQEERCGIDGRHLPAGPSDRVPLPSRRSCRLSGMLEVVRPTQALSVKDGQVDLRPMLATGAWARLPRRHKVAFPTDSDPESMLIEWLHHMSTRPNARWLYIQVLAGIAKVMEASFEPKHDALVALRGNIADFGRRCDPAVRRAICMVARAKLGGARLHKAALVLGKTGLGRNRNHIHCEMAAYYRQLRRTIQDTKQFCIAPDDSRFHGKNFCLAPVMDLASGMVGWAPPKAA